MSADCCARGALPFSRISGLLRLLLVILVGASTSNTTHASAGSAQISSAGSSGTFADMTTAELVREVHELKNVQPAESQDDLPRILKRTGETVQDFFDNFSNTTSTEHISARLDSRAHIGVSFYDGKNQYLALASKGDMKTLLEEMRMDGNGNPANLNSWSGVVTSGFVSMAAHFYPDYQKDSNFRLVGRENVHGTDAYVVAFAQRPKVARQTLHAEFFGRSATIYMQGVAWIDPQSFQIFRLHTNILHPEDGIGLASETTEIEYSEVKFENGKKSLWLPRTVKVDGQMDRFAFHNMHTYSNYRLFSVQSRGIPVNH